MVECDFLSCVVVRSVTITFLHAALQIHPIRLETLQGKEPVSADQAPQRRSPSAPAYLQRIPRTSSPIPDQSHNTADSILGAVPSASPIPGIASTRKMANNMPLYTTPEKPTS